MALSAVFLVLYQADGALAPLDLNLGRIARLGQAIARALVRHERDETETYPTTIVQMLAINSQGQF